MPIASMTGFARFEGEIGEAAFIWELRSVNGKGLDLRLRLPQGLEPIEADIRRLAAARLSRGNVQISLQMRRVDDAPVFTVNEAMLAQVLSLSDRLIAAGHAVTPTSDGILSVKGIIEVAGETVPPEEEAARRKAVLDGFVLALDRLVAARQEEGEALGRLLRQRLQEAEALVAAADVDPARTSEAIRQRLEEQVRDLVAGDDRIDPQRLYQEVAILATKADIREEIDRLRTHLATTFRLLEEGGPVGRRLDFLSQEFNRESNTICSKSNAAAVTAAGIELKVVIDQFREQVQNLE